MSSPLFTAARGGFADTVRKLIENVNDVNIVDELGCTPLWLAARRGHSEVVRILLEHKGTVHNIRDPEGDSPMDVAVSYGHAEVLRVLLVNDTVIAEAVENKKRLLYLAARCNQVETLEVLLDQLDAEVNTQDDQGDSLLAIAAYMGYFGIVQFLLQYANIDVNLRDNLGRCPLSHAVCPGKCGAVPGFRGRFFVENHIKVVHAMVSHPDIDINSKDYEGHTPLSLAIDTGQWALVEPILAHSKIKVETEDDSDWTKSLDTLIKVMTPRATRSSEEHIDAQYAEKVFRYFVEKRDFKVDWTQEDASDTILDALEQEKMNSSQLCMVFEKFPLDLPGHCRLVESLVAIFLRKADWRATDVIFKYSTLVPDLSSDEWLSRLEAGFQQADAYDLEDHGLEDYCQVLQRLLERDTSFPKCKNERVDNVLGIILLRAAGSDHGAQIFKSLACRENVDFNYRDNNNCTALWVAADKDKLENIKQLLNIDDIEVHHKDDTDHETAVLRLLEYVEHLTLQRDDDWEDATYESELATATELTERLLRKNTKQMNGLLLIQTATLGLKNAASLLLGSAEIEPNERGANSTTPLISASMHGQEGIVKLLLGDSRVTPTLEDDFHHSAFHAAILSGHNSIAKLLWERDKITWIRFCNNGLVDELKLLHKIGLLLNARDSRGQTPLHLACRKGDVRMIRELVKVGLDVNEEDTYGVTPLRSAIKSQHIDAVKVLVGGSADMKGITRTEWLALYNEYGGTTVLEISKNPLGETTLHFNDITNTRIVRGTTTDTYRLTSFYNQEVFMSKLPPTLKAALVHYTRGAMFDVVQDEVAWFGSSFDVPLTQDEVDAPELRMSWHANRVAWKMQNTISGGHPAWETVVYASSLPCGWIPDSASDFLATFILDVEQGWILFLDHADEYLAHQRSRQIDERGMSPALIDGLAKDAQIWARLRTRHKFQVDSFKWKYDTFCQAFRQGDHKEATMRAIDEFSSKVADRLAKLDQTTRDLLQLEFAWVSIREAHLSTSLATSMKRLSWITFIFLPMTFASSLFGMNVDILEDNPNWRWFLLFAGGALVITFVVWLTAKYFNIESLLERHLGTRLQRLSDPTARKSASSYSL